MMSRPRFTPKLLMGFAAVLGLFLLPVLTAEALHESLIFKVKNISQLTLEDLVKDLKGVRVITVGEQHNNRDHHQVQLMLINALHEAGYDLALGFEQFGAASQAGLDQWVAGKSGPEDLYRIYSRDWEINWWPLYVPIFDFAREHKLPMVGLNISREIVRQVAGKGFSSLNEKQRDEIKVLSCNIDQKYKETLRKVLGQKGKGHGDAMFNNFCEAQVVWDTSMALNAVEYLEANPQKTMVIIAGNFHAWKHGIPEQITRVADMEVRSILPSEDTSFFNYDIFIADADYVWWLD